MKKLITALLIWLALTGIACAQNTTTITLTWDHSIDHAYLTTYRAYWTKDAGPEQQVDVGLGTSYVFPALVDGRYCFALTAIDTRGLESIRTPTVCDTAKTIILPPTNPTITQTINIAATTVNITTQVVNLEGR